MILFPQYIIRLEFVSDYSSDVFLLFFLSFLAYERIALKNQSFALHRYFVFGIYSCLNRQVILSLCSVSVGMLQSVPKKKKKKIFFKIIMV